jgi:eukaryotic-like serine/threonine-protein kinase
VGDAGPDQGQGAGEIRAETRLLDRGEIGAGGMGTVRRVVDAQIGRTVAMKVFDPERSRADDAAQRFVQEGQITGQLDHPHIVPVYQLAQETEPAPFFTMKLVHGRTLGELIDERDLARPSEHELERLLRTLVQVCQAVSFAHSRGVVHLDLKPDNVMVGTHGQVYVMDWGCARLLPGRAPGDPAVRLSAPAPQREGRVMGTFTYMPPEQARGRVGDIDERSDVFALGGMLYRLLTHRPPYQGDDYRQVLTLAQRGYVEPPAEVVPAGVHVPAGLARIAMKALAADKDERYPSVDAFEADLEDFLRGGSWLAQRTYPAGAVIVREGEPGDEAFIVTQGRCEAVKEEGGRAVGLRTMGPGAVFGEAALLASQPRTATVVAREDLTVLVVARQALENELCVDSWSGVFVRALAERFRDLDGQLDLARRREREAGIVQWAREQVLTEGRPLGEGRWEAAWSEVVRALPPQRAINEEILAALLERAPGMVLDRSRGMLTVSRAV